MATPVGHALLGAGVGLACSDKIATSWRWIVFLAFSGCAADLDFVPGLIAGDINRWHHLASHSILAAIIWGILTGVFLRYRRPESACVVAGSLAALAYGSHLLLDCLTTDTRAPHGIPLFWPVSDTAWISPVTPIPGVRHGVEGDGFWVVVEAVFSMSNFYGALIEAIIVVPVVLVLWTGRRMLGRHNQK